MSAKRDGSETNRKGLTARQVRLAACIASGMTDAAACRQCRVGVTTLWTWKKQPAFRERIAELQRELVERAVHRLSDLMAGKALDALTDRLDRTDPETGERVTTLPDICAAFELFINVTNAADLKARIEELERGRK
jgi:hypothetical protein